MDDNGYKDLSVSINSDDKTVAALWSQPWINGLSGEADDPTFTKSKQVDFIKNEFNPCTISSLENEGCRQPYEELEVPLGSAQLTAPITKNIELLDAASTAVRRAGSNPRPRGSSSALPSRMDAAPPSLLTRQTLRSTGAGRGAEEGARHPNHRPVGPAIR